jgi:hypothetical protein
MDHAADTGPTAGWVVRLHRRGAAAPAAVGPFPTEEDAAAWACTSLDGSDGWSWGVEAVVPPEVLAARWSPRRRHLRLLS